jgi:hypothetical protein
MPLASSPSKLSSQYAKVVGTTKVG